MSFVISRDSNIYSDGIADSEDRVKEIMHGHLNQSEKGMTVLKDLQGKSLLVFWLENLESWTILQEGQCVIPYAPRHNQNTG